MVKVNYKKGAQLGLMIKLAVDGFNGVTDRSGRPYILHCLTVMHYLMTDDEELQCAAVGHDMVEDGKITYRELYRLFSSRIVETIRNVSKVPGETDDEYVTRVMLSYDSVLVKLADIRHNSDIRRLKGLTDKDLARVAKYHRFHTVLRSAKADYEKYGSIQPSTIALNKELNSGIINV